jgi:putative nucleotidyltransferase with HDIG domain
MDKAATMDKKGRAYESLVAMSGLAVWLTAVVPVGRDYAWRDHLILLALVPVALIVGIFPLTFPIPSSLRLTSEKVNFSLSDAIVLLIACWLGVWPAVFVAGVEGFTASRRAVRRLSSNVFSFGMMSLVAGASGGALSAVLRQGFGEPGVGAQQSFTAVAVALLAASIVHVVLNTALFSTFFALRERAPVLPRWSQSFLWAAPIFLPTSVVASLLYMALQYNALATVVIGAPALLALYFGHRQYRDSVRERINLIEKSNQERITVMDTAHRQTIEALAVAINAKDEVTHEHVLRVQIYAAGVARILGCTDAEVEALRAGALLHDIGKIAVPDHIINKPGKLTAAEFDKMKLHTVAGAQILSRVEFPYPVVPVVRHHHERWDGKGYPDGLQGEAIPLTARVLSVVDCFDAVREDRQYRKAMTRDEAINYIMEGSGSFYDPRVVGVFITHLPEFEAEIQAHRGDPAPNYGIEPMEQLSDAALKVAPAAGLADESKSNRFGAEAREDEAQQNSLRQLSVALQACASTEDALAVFVEQLGALAPFDTCAVTRVAPESGESVVVYAAGRNSHLLEGRVVQPGEGVTGWTLANRQPFCNADPKLDLHPHLAERFAGYRTLAALPVESGGEARGALTVYSVALAEYDANQQSLLRQAADLLAVAFNLPAAAPRPEPALAALITLPLPDTTINSELTH